MDKLSLIASMAATLEAGDRAANVLLKHSSDYASRSYDLYAAALEEIRRRDSKDWSTVPPMQSEAA